MILLPLSAASLLYSARKSKKISQESPLFFTSDVMGISCVSHYFCV
nr:MAG TPA: hypothetical protein [Caudoviricetes sp.]